MYTYLKKIISHTFLQGIEEIDTSIVVRLAEIKEKVNFECGWYR